MASNDPQFEEKAAAIIGLYLNPPQNAAVFCVVRRARFRPWVGLIDAYLCRRDVRRNTDSNTIATGHYRCTRR